MKYTQQQITGIGSDIRRYCENNERLEDISRMLSFYWELCDDLGREPELEKALDYASRNLQSRFRWIRDYLHDQINLASYIASHLDEEGNFILKSSEDDEDDEMFTGSSTIRTRLVQFLFDQGMEPEVAVDALHKILHDRKSQPLDFLQSKRLSPYPERYEAEELKRRLRVHIFGQEHEDELDREWAERQQRIKEIREQRNQERDENAGE
jgi:hypothetical protein